MSTFACAAVLVLAGCSEQSKEVSKAAEAEARFLMSEAVFAMSIREHARAEELMQRALVLHDEVPEYWVALGRAQRQQDNKAGARKAYEKALALHVKRFKTDKDPAELGKQAYVIALLGRTDEALKMLEKILKDHPDNPEVRRQADPRGFPRTFQTPEFKELAL